MKNAARGQDAFLYFRWLLLAIIVVPAQIFPAGGFRASAATRSITGLHVVGNHIENENGQVVRLLGVNRSGTEYACIQGWGFFDGPSDAASIQAIASWHVNVVRIPLNEDCWLGINGAPGQYSGANYQQAITNYVSLLNQNGMAAILELHWNAPGTSKATGQNPMPDQDHALAFWSSVASAFKGNSSVIFDLFNEPYPDNNQDSTAAWTCWKKGGTCSGVSYQVAGMQNLVQAVRSAGAQNLIMVGGVQYADALSRWLAYEPSDPQHNLAASWHSYANQVCGNASCWTGTIAPVAAKVPMITGEIGENDCAHSYIDSLMPWLDSHDISYLGWAWNVGNCAGFPSLISDYSGAPTAFGQGFHDHLTALANSPSTPAPVGKSQLNVRVTTSSPLRVRQSASIRVSIADNQQGQPVNGVAVTLDARAVGVKKVHRATSKHGAVTFNGIRPRKSGIISITASKRGYDDQSVTLQVH